MLLMIGLIFLFIILVVAIIVGMIKLTFKLIFAFPFLAILAIALLCCGVM